MRVQAPAPARCVACGSSRLEPWLWAEPQESSLQTAYRLVRCPACGSASTTGPPASELMELYESGTYAAVEPRASRLIEAVRALYERQKLDLLRTAGVRPPARLIDAGAGQGRFVLAARARGYEAGGFEPSLAGVETAAARGVELRCGGFDDPELSFSGADVVSCWHVLEHLDDPEPALARIGSWLAPGGALLLGVPNLASLQARIAGERWLHLDVPRHRHHFTPTGLRLLLGRQGFRVVCEKRVLVEHNLFGMWQSWLDRATTTPAYAYNLVKRNVAPNARDLAATAAVAALAPLAVFSEALAGLSGRAGTIAVVARRG